MAATDGVGFVNDESYFWHRSRVDYGPDVEPDAQMETPEPRRRLLNLLRRKGLLDLMRPMSPDPLSTEDLLRVHTPGYLVEFRRLSDGLGGEIGDHAGFGPGSYEIAVTSAGGVSAAVRTVLEGRVGRAYALVRPPGHHAEPHRARGFCLLANIPIAIEKARAETGLRRVAIVDWDVHHGNGAQVIYASDPDVLAVSLHQDSLYPAESGAIDERGEGPGEGTTINIPLPAGCGSGAYEAAFDRVVQPAVERFAPELIIVACGFDAGIMDPSSQMALPAQTFGALTERMMSLADRLCSGRLVIAQEGGYSPLHTPFCGAALVAALTGSDTVVHDPQAQRRHRPVNELLPHQEAVIAAVQEATGLAPVAGGIAQRSSLSKERAG